MSSILAALLGKPEEHILATINKLEHKAGYSSEDVRLLAENSQKVRSKITDLGLDPTDTTGEELYHALLARFGRDADIIDRSLGVSSETSNKQKIIKAEEFVNHMLGKTEVWSAKSSALKKILEATPPTKTMDAMGYRSVASLLKHEDVSKVALVANFLESATWKKVFSSKLAKLDSSNYELKDIKLFDINDNTWPVKSNNICVANGRLGAIGVFASSLSTGANVLSIALVLHDNIVAISSNQGGKKLSNLNPIMHWWEEAEHLMAWNEGKPVSLNFRDIAKAHIGNVGYEDRNKDYASQAFWSELIRRYKVKVDELPEDIMTMTHQAEQIVDDVFNPSKDMALELQSLDENG